MKLKEFRQFVREIVLQELQAHVAAHDDHEKPHEKPDTVHAEGICEGDDCLEEKSVPQPYNRKSARKMTKSQIDLRKKIGKAMMRDEKKVSKFRKKYGDEWKDYLWAAASSAAFRQSGTSSGDDTK